MKICPACQASFPNGFQYCPNDTELLLTSEEYVRRTQPLAKTPAPEVIPLASQPQTPPLEPTPPLEEAPAPMPSHPPAAGRGSGQGLNSEVRTEATAIHRQASPAPEETDLHFSLPEPGSLITRLGGAIQQFVKDFGKSAPPVRPGDIEGFNISIPEQGSLITRLGGAIQQFAKDFGKSTPQLRPGDTGDFQFLLADESLAARLKREFRTNAAEFKRDPRGFLRETLRGEGSSRRRRRLMQAGMAMAVIAYAFIFISLLLAGLLRYGRTTEGAEKKEELREVARLMDIPSVEVPKEQMPKGKGNFAGGSKPKPEKASGGGGGGRNQPTPPSKGNLPQAALTPQIVMPNPEPPKIKNPSLPVPMTVYADPKALPEFKGGPIGLPTGVPGPPSSGPGDGAGIGTGRGTGVGPGEGGGVGPGRGGNTGGGDFGLGGRGGIEEAGRNGAGKPQILYKEKAKYTEEARQNKVQGTVLLSAIFNSDGRITGIKVIRGLPDGLTEKAIEAAQKIRFLPATKNGVPITVRATLEFSFNLY